jgi:hypothetical protein
MTRLTAEIAEESKPDAASSFGTRTGDTREGWGGGLPERFVASRQAAQAAPIRPNGLRSPVEDSKIASAYVLQGLCGASLKHRAWDAGGTGGLAVSSIRNALASRDARVRGSDAAQAVHRGPPASRAPSDFLIQDR